MRAVLGRGFLPVGLTFCLWAAVAEESGTKSAQGPARPKFAIYSEAADAELASSLLRVLRDKEEKVTRVARVDTVEAAAESNADVLILVMTQRETRKFEKQVLDALKERKIIGIGFGAAQLFGQLGLEISGGNCMHGIFQPTTIKIVKCALLGDAERADPVPVFAENPQETELNVSEIDFFAMFAPPRGKNAAAVDVIARWSKDMNYAPIVRQGNCILVGVPVPATLWSSAYSELMRNVCLRVQKQKLEPFATARRELTKAGTYKFTLAKRDSPDEPFSKTFFFRFSEPRKITARLEHSGSKAVMLLFMGEDENHAHWARKDARQEEALEIITEISREDIDAIGDRHWTVDVTNFDADSIAECKLTIAIEEP